MKIYDKEQLFNDLEKAVNSGNELVLISHSILDNTDETIKFIIKKALKSDENDIVSAIFCSLKEISTNALKANLKSLIISENGYSEKDSAEILAELKKALTEKELQNYAEKCKKKHLFITIHFIFNSPEYLKIKIINPVPLDKIQFERINMKIEKSKGYESLAHFFMENPDPMAEGMGLGLSMVVVILKGLGISPENLIINTDNKNKTTAILKIPYKING